MPRLWADIDGHMAYMAYQLGNIEISEKNKRVEHLRPRNIEISEKKKHVYRRFKARRTTRIYIYI